jgi:hypothetical protein
MPRTGKRKTEKRTEAHVYLDPDIAAAIRASAEQNGRSFQGEIRFALRQRYLGSSQAAE